MHDSDAVQRAANQRSCALGKLPDDGEARRSQTPPVQPISQSQWRGEERLTGQQLGAQLSPEEGSSGARRDTQMNTKETNREQDEQTNDKGCMILGAMIAAIQPDLRCEAVYSHG